MRFISEPRVFGFTGTPNIVAVYLGPAFFLRFVLPDEHIDAHSLLYIEDVLIRLSVGSRFFLLRVSV